MLALPVATANYGFIPATVLFLTCWIFMTFAALLMLEVNLWLPAGSNLLTMAKATLGRTGQAIAWMTYLLLLYSLMAAYLSGMDSIITDTLNHYFQARLDPWVGFIALVFVFGFIIYLGARPIDYINRILIAGLVITFSALVVFTAPHVQPRMLIQKHYHSLWIALPIIITSIGYQIIIPSLRTYLQSDAKKLRLAILIGSSIPLFVYILWEFIILGVVPVHGEHGLLSILASGQPAVGLTKALNQILQTPYISIIAKFFAFFAISTSFIGVSFSLFDFLSDGFRIKKSKLGRISTALMTFIPPMVFALVYPSGFILALGYAGIFVAILLCIMPAMMINSGRYWSKMATGYQVGGGKIALTLLVAFAIIVIGTEIL